MKARSSHLSHPTLRISICTACSRYGQIDRVTRTCAAPIGARKMKGEGDLYAQKTPENKRVAYCKRVQEKKMNAKGKVE